MAYLYCVIDRSGRWQIISNDVRGILEVRFCSLTSPVYNQYVEHRTKLFEITSVWSRIENQRLKRQQETGGVLITIKLYGDACYCISFVKRNSRSMLFRKPNTRVFHIN